MEIRKIEIIVDDKNYEITLQTNLEPEEIIAKLHTALMNGNQVEAQVSKKFAKTIKNAIEQLTFMKSLLNHQGESAGKKEINNCLGCNREKKINEIIEQLSKFSC